MVCRKGVSMVTNAGQRWPVTIQPDQTGQRWPMISIVVSFLLVLLAGCGRSPVIQPTATAGPAVIAVKSQLLETDRNPRLHVGDPAPNFAYTLTDGSTHTLHDLRGQKVLINFWATWCAPCEVEMPDLERAAQQLGDAGLVVLAVNHSEQVDVIESFAQKLGITFPLIANPDRDIIHGFGVINLPTSYFIDTNGLVSYKHIGLMNFHFIKQRVEEMP